MHFKKNSLAVGSNPIVRAEILEVFSSLQGEGPYLGVKQIFVRFRRCNMHCGYCDEADKMKSGPFRVMAVPDLLKEVTSLESTKGQHHSVSLTGGEPLVYASFLAEFMPELKKHGFKTYLETNGTLTRELAQMLSYTDIVAMDLKPASATGDRDFSSEHEAFLRLAVQKEVFVKTVITPGTKKEDVLRCIEIVAAVDARIPFILQPMSDLVGINVRSLQNIESTFFHEARSRLQDVRVIPQMHKIWGVR